MKKQLLLIFLFAFLVILNSCGGGDSDSAEVVIDGTWVGTLEYADNDPPIGSSIEEVTERVYTLTLTTSIIENEDVVGFLITDSLGNSYSGRFKGNVAIAHNDAEGNESDGKVETGPSNITFENFTSETADVTFIYFFGFRGVVDIYKGEFRKIDNSI